MQATILDANSSTGLHSGKLYIDSGSGPVLLATSDANGNIQADIPESSPNVLITVPGYAPKVIDAGDIEDNQIIPMTASAIEPVSPQGGPAAPSVLSQVPWWVWVGTAGIIIYAGSDSKKKNNVGDASGYILPIGILIAAYFLLDKFGLFSTTTGTGANNDAATSTIAKGTEQTLTALASSGIVPTLSSAQAASIANTIFNAGLTVNPGSSQGAATIFNLLAQSQNDADIYLIMQNFGTRKVSNSAWSLCSLVNLNCDALDLDSFVTAILNEANIPGLTLQDLNYQLANNELGPTGITYQF
jgi:hypothetical protein